MSEVISMKKPHEITYSKPNIGALRGRVGKSIIETILNAQRPDHTELKKEAEDFVLRLRASRTNE